MKRKLAPEFISYTLGPLVVGPCNCAKIAMQRVCHSFVSRFAARICLPTRQKRGKAVIWVHNSFASSQQSATTQLRLRKIRWPPQRNDTRNYTSPYHKLSLQTVNHKPTRISHSHLPCLTQKRIHICVRGSHASAFARFISTRANGNAFLFAFDLAI